MSRSYDIDHEAEHAKACHNELVAACEIALANLAPAYSSEHLVIKSLRAALANAAKVSVAA